VKIEVHDEAGREAARTFVESWLSVAARQLTALIGDTRRDETVHVVLSDTDVHQRRFPPRSNDLAALFGPDDEEELSAAAEEIPASLYAHGVTTIASSSQAPPAAVPIGAPVIYLDVETITELAQQRGVSPEAMLARVVVHELSHALRGHAEPVGLATHGYFAEGDAQRDAWQVMGDLLANPEWQQIAREARVAQVRLAREQPPAYRRFGRGSPDTGRWADHDPPEVQSWLLRAPRRLLTIARDSIVEVPIRSANSSMRPAIGDLVLLTEDDLVVGPWVVVARSDHPYVGHDVDTRAVESESSGAGRQRPSIEWLHLRRRADAAASDEAPDDLRLSPKMLCKEIEADATSALVGADSLEQVLERAADRKRTEHAEAMSRWAVELTAEGLEVPEALRTPYDPYADY
jgi:hypothetical protein